MQCSNQKNITEISLPYPLYQSKKGRYFIGQTPLLTGKDKHALAGLSNPTTSNVNIYVNAITITNISNLNLSAEFYLKSKVKGALVSDLVSCANLSIVPEPTPSGKIKYLTTTTQPPSGGVPIFSRIVSPYSTLVVDGGQIILPPGQSLFVYIGDFLPVVFDNVKFAFGWWEEPICNYHNYGC
ncbi:hypothetical protein CHF27_012330 [Romboutsia maritimum]|uniref:Uncharacterized protein n=1 Tax=Romboutsia maritimum TaxID=2020948 RepID=A0A371IQ90_9FIRM|nr:DUF6143 family protein [Romboutsia maritimum]RDY22654.1 hypothetical protein CHF27_012330 [Romboutsia maritimum]